MIIKKVCDKYGIEVRKAPSSEKSKILRNITQTRKIAIGENGERRLDWIFDLISKSNWAECSEAYGSDFLSVFFTYYSNNINDLDNAKIRAIKAMSEVSPTEFISKAMYRYNTYKRVAALTLMFCNNI